MCSIISHKCLNVHHIHKFECKKDEFNCLFQQGRNTFINKETKK